VRAAGHAADYMEHDNAAFCAAQAAKSTAWAVYAEEDCCCFRTAQAASEGASWAASVAGYEIFATQLENRDFGPSAKVVRDNARKRFYGNVQTLCGHTEYSNRTAVI
jgi:hypothetical protein